MFDNVGSKLQIMAFVFFIIGTIASVILGIATWIAGSFWYGLLVIVIGILSSWLSNLAIFGIGVCAENSETTIILLKEIKANQLKTATQHTDNAPQTAPKANINIDAAMSGWTCACGAKNTANANFCYVCMASRPKK